MADVFISYARSTVECAEALARILEANGHSVWYDARLPAHRAYADVIQEELDSAKAVLIIWSREAVHSQWVRSEADRARMNGTLIQLRIDNCVLPMPFDQIECPVVQSWNGDGDLPALSPVLTSLSELLNGGPVEPMLAQRKGRRPARSEEPQLLVDAATKCLQSGQPDEHAQAIPLLVEATRIAPDDAEVWGLLAVLYAARRSEVPPSDRPAMIARARSAIKAARNLDPDELRSRCAEVILIPAYRNWERKEKGARAILDRVPDQPLALFSLATVLAQTGRWADAADTAKRISRTRFLLPAVEEFTVYALWGAGDIVQAELAGEVAARRFPTHSGLFEARLALLTHSGRAFAALNLIDSASPRGYPSPRLQAARATALALGNGQGHHEAICHNLKAAEDGDLEALTVAVRCAALGAPEECFSLLEGYYLERGPWAAVAPPGGDEDRSTMSLFMPPMERIWHDKRFEALNDVTGLAGYWHEIDSKPDFLTYRLMAGMGGKLT